jgi:hypothetical protein
MRDPIPDQSNIEGSDFYGWVREDTCDRRLLERANPGLSRTGEEQLFERGIVGTPRIHLWRVEIAQRDVWAYCTLMSSSLMSGGGIDHRTADRKNLKQPSSTEFGHSIASDWRDRHGQAARISCLIRCTVPVPSPSVLATFKMPTPFWSCVCALRSRATSILRRPRGRHRRNRGVRWPWRQDELGLGSSPFNCAAVAHVAAMAEWDLWKNRWVCSGAGG